MAVKLRMTRIGRRHRPFFRINAVESRRPRDGRIIEKLGHYDPIEKDPAKQIVLKRERIEYWLEQGAIPSDTVSQILLRHGIKNKYVEEKAARRARAKALARAKGRFFTKAEEIAAQKAAEKAKAEADADAKAKAEQEKPKAEQEEPKAAEAKAETDAEAKAEQKKPKAEQEERKAAEEKAKADAEAKAEQEKPKAVEEETEVAKETSTGDEQAEQEKQTAAGQETGNSDEN